MTDQEVKLVGYTLAGYYASKIEDNYSNNNFEDFGADAIKHCYEYIQIIDDIEIPWITENGEKMVDTETYRDTIETTIKEKYVN